MSPLEIKNKFDELLVKFWKADEEQSAAVAIVEKKHDEKYELMTKMEKLQDEMKTLPEDDQLYIKVP
jgi:autonomous glycyl radical cofactor GrcA